MMQHGPTSYAGDHMFFVRRHDTLIDAPPEAVFDYVCNPHSWPEWLPASHKILIHVNNTNPILDEDSPERAELSRAGIEVAYDGMEVKL